jgi:hypothetical protein
MKKMEKKRLTSANLLAKLISYLSDMTNINGRYDMK